MVFVELPAVIACAENGCLRTLPARLALTSGGGLAFAPQKPEAFNGWSVATPAAGPIICRCPVHPSAKVALIPDAAHRIVGSTH